MAAMSTLAAMLPYAGKVLKYTFFLLLALNARSLPLMWHIRILFKANWMWYLRRRLSGNTRKFMEFCSPIGKSPFEVIHVMQGLATLDDCDMFGHLSNSSYAKTLDIVRLQVGAQFFPSWYSIHRGVTPLGGADYSFIKEIPILGRYEMRTAIGGWDHKWMYLITYFVSYPKGSRAKKVEKELIPPAPLPRGLLPPGAILHSVCNSRICFKQGRLTTPPTIAISLSGMGGTEAIGRARWARKQQLTTEGKLNGILKANWNDELARPFQEGGWELKELEAERRKGMATCGKLLTGLEDLRPIAE
ncbi:hypothetical protein CALVIDRAFT_595341 [Calocera viscosa TUFC12733]|uniref:Thioesterase/thiol ester dehydrase-isomerase n=1 Tax=Calocera viscosa (strain TUFC12733) TaxID=1330018 RepID=A0A167R4K2_CALVF|nr:hypothetical protein CALVIDRAFT_595341 [Calocera viscosa TUFC12733]